MQSSVSSVELEEHSVGMSFVELIPDSQMVEPDDPPNSVISRVVCNKTDLPKRNGLNPSSR